MNAFVLSSGGGGVKPSRIASVSRTWGTQAGSRRIASVRMAATAKDTVITLSPYFKVHDGKMDEFKKHVEKFYELIKSENKLVNYSFCFTDDGRALCREGYEDAEGLKIHLDNVGENFKSALGLSDLERIELHAPASEMEKLKDHPVIASLNTVLYTLDGQGVRR